MPITKGNKVPNAEYLRAGVHDRASRRGDRHGLPQLQAPREALRAGRFPIVAEVTDSMAAGAAWKGPALTAPGTSLGVCVRRRC